MKNYSTIFMHKLLHHRLSEIKNQHLLRQLSPISGIDLTSSDYLGFAEDPLLKQRFLARLVEPPLGASGSRLLRGNLAPYEETESLLARFVDREAAVLFPSGYQANIALLTALLRSEDLVFSDALNHASLIDGIRLSKAHKIIYPHKDLQFLEHALQSHHSSGLKIIVTESLFSMDGDLADLSSLAHLATRYNALLIVDEAHSTGLWGPSLVSQQSLCDQVFASIHTGGKALGAGGAWIAGSHLLKDTLVNFARPFIFSTAPIPALALLLQEAIHYYREIGESRTIAVREKARYLRGSLLGTAMGDPESPIVPILIGDNKKTLHLSLAMQARGWDVRAIRPPTVPDGTARLRVTVKWNNLKETLENFAQDLNLLRGSI